MPTPVHAGATGLGRTRVYWAVPSAIIIEVRVGAPDGPLFAAGGAEGSSETGDWVRDGTVFSLQDGSRGNPTAHEQTVAAVRVAVSERQ